jgi:hypothetical protein
VFVGVTTGAAGKSMAHRGTCAVLFTSTVRQVVPRPQGGVTYVIFTGSGDAFHGTPPTDVCPPAIPRLLKPFALPRDLVSVAPVREC